MLQYKHIYTPITEAFGLKFWGFFFAFVHVYWYMTNKYIPYIFFSRIHGMCVPVSSDHLTLFILNSIVIDFIGVEMDINFGEP